jgi:hypothetical protein
MLEEDIRQAEELANVRILWRPSDERSEGQHERRNYNLAL